MLDVHARLPLKSEPCSFASTVLQQFEPSVLALVSGSKGMVLIQIP